MSGWGVSSLLKPEALGLGLLMLVAAFFVGLGIRFVRKRRPTPEELERRRRELIHRLGKISDGEIIDCDGVSIVYTYQVGGVGYTAAQDLRALGSFLPSDYANLIGPVALKFDRRNPANSIVVCEQWSGFHQPRNSQAGSKPSSITL